MAGGRGQIRCHWIQRCGIAVKAGDQRIAVLVSCAIIGIIRIICLNEGLVRVRIQGHNLCKVHRRFRSHGDLQLQKQLTRRINGSGGGGLVHPGDKAKVDGPILHQHTGGAKAPQLIRQTVRQQIAVPVDGQHSRVIRHGVLHHGKGLHTGKRKGYGIIPGRQCIAVYRPALAVRKGTGEVGLLGAQGTLGGQRGYRG